MDHNFGLARGRPGRPGSHRPGSRRPGSRRPAFRGLGFHRPAAILTVVATAMAIAACGSSSSSSSSSVTNAAATSTPTASSSGSGGSGVSQATANLAQYKAPVTSIGVTTPLKGTPPAGKTVVMLATNNPSNVLLQQSLKKLAGMVHWNYQQVSYDPANPATFQAAINTAITKHANYIAEAGIPLTDPEIKQVQNAGAKWVLTAVYPVKLAPPIIVDSDSYANDAVMGKIVADFFVSDSGGKGVAVIEHVPAYPILDAFTNTFQDRVKSLCPSCQTKIVNITIPDLVAGKTASQIVSALRSTPGANYVVFDDGPFAAGVLPAMQSAGLTGKVKVIGEAADDTAIAELKAGKNTAWTGFDPVYSTYQMMDAMLRDAEGTPVPTAQEGTQPTQLLTKDTVGSISSWSQPTDALAQWAKLWHVNAG